MSLLSSPMEKKVPAGVELVQYNVFSNPYLCCHSYKHSCFLFTQCYIQCSKKYAQTIVRMPYAHNFRPAASILQSTYPPRDQLPSNISVKAIKMEAEHAHSAFALFVVYFVEMLV